MPRSSLKQQLGECAESQHVLLGANADNPEMVLGIAQAVKITAVPLFLQFTPQSLAIWGYDTITAIMAAVLDPLPTPIAWHLDHATHVEDITQALDYGFTSVMYDGSALPMEENIRQTQKVVAQAHARGASVESEIGHVPKPGEPEQWAQLTTPEEAWTFVHETGVDRLAVAIGNHHATHVASSQIDFERLAAIHARCPVPLVLHGASGIDPGVYARLRQAGITKMNFGTEFRTIWWETTQAMTNHRPREVQAEIIRRMANAIQNKWNQLSS